VCEFLGKTPSEVGELRRKSPQDIEFIEQHIIWEAEERHKAMEEAERKAKASKHKGRRR
jgi:hypothetical protein